MVEFDSLNTFTANIYCVENSTGGTGLFTHWCLVMEILQFQYPTLLNKQVHNLCLTYTDANGCGSNYCDAIISSKSSGYALY